MPISIHQLQPGDRVILNCPKARLMPKREAVFEGIFHSLADAVSRETVDAVAIHTDAARFLDAGIPWARFLVRRDPASEIVVGLQIDADGNLREQQGMQVYIERRLVAERGSRD